MLNHAFFKPMNLIIIAVIVLIWHLTLGKFLTNHVEKKD